MVGSKVSETLLHRSSKKRFDLLNHRGARGETTGLKGEERSLHFKKDRMELCLPFGP